MRYPPALDAALSLLSATGMRSGRYAPPAHRLMWRFGWYVAPPHLATFTGNVFFLGAWFGLTFGVVMSIAAWSREGVPIVAQVVVAIFAGLAFGLSMAIYYRRGARKQQLPSWSQFKAQHGEG